ncbi:MAG: hypothetical protein QXO37_08725 [Candidatus Nitrosocaldaceae archaeon]
MRRLPRGNRVIYRETIATIQKLVGKEFKHGELNNCDGSIIVEENGYDIKLFNDGSAIVLRVYKGIGWLVLAGKLVQFWINWDDTGRYYHSNYTSESVIDAFYNSKNINEFLESLEYYQPQD